MRQMGSKPGGVWRSVLITGSNTKNALSIIVSVGLWAGMLSLVASIL
jgi:hypothetical protein